MTARPMARAVGWAIAPRLFDAAARGSEPSGSSRRAALPTRAGAGSIARQTDEDLAVGKRAAERRDDVSWLEELT